MYFAYKARTIKSVQVKFRDVKQLGSMHLYTKLQRSTFRHLEEIGVESCQNVSALPADKPYSLRIQDNSLLLFLSLTSRFNYSLIPS